MTMGYRGEISDMSSSEYRAKSEEGNWATTEFYMYYLQLQEPGFFQNSYNRVPIKTITLLSKAKWKHVTRANPLDLRRGFVEEYSLFSGHGPWLRCQPLAGST